MKNLICILAVLVTLSLVAGCGGSNPIATPLSTSASQPTDTPAPTATPKPTNTPVPPTETPTPTDTPTTTPTPLLTPSPVPTPTPWFDTLTGRLAYVSDSEEYFGIVVKDLGTDAEPAKLVWFGFDPAWSPEGTRIAFSRGGLSTDYTTGVDICVLDMTSNKILTVTSQMPPHFSSPHVYYNLDPSWSPDGDRIVFASYPVGVEELEASSGELTLLISTLMTTSAYGPGEVEYLVEDYIMFTSPFNAILMRDPCWSVDGDHFLFGSQTSVGYVTDDGQGVGPLLDHIYEVSLDLVEFRDLTPRQFEDVSKPPLYYTSPACSPDGRRIAFTGDWDLYVANSDGSNRVQLTEGTDVWEPSWSPDGKYLAFESEGGIYVVRSELGPDGMPEEPIFIDEGQHPTWGP